MSSRCLITGAQGFIGRYLTAHILRGDPSAQVMGIGRSASLAGFFSHRISLGGRQIRAPLPREIAVCVDERFRYVQLSLLETARLGELIHSFRPSLIFHLASALSSASEAQLFRSNIDGTSALMDAIAAQAEPKPTVILASSGAVYGATASLPHRESDRTDPADMYGVMKLASEQIAGVKARRAGFDIVYARIYNVVGPGQVEAHVCGRFAAELANRRLRPGSLLKVGNLDTTRDFIDVRDVSAALLIIARRGESDAAYNVAAGRETAIRDILRQLIATLGCQEDVQIESADGRRFDVARHFADISRLRRLGFAPRYTLADSLRDVLAYYAKRRSPDLMNAAELVHNGA